MSIRSETLREGHSRLLRAWLAVAIVLVAAVLALVLWANFGSSTGTGSSGEAKVDKPGKITQMYPDGRFGEPIQVGDFVCQQCQ
jgi:hypothetical protein